MLKRYLLAAVLMGWAGAATAQTAPPASASSAQVNPGLWDGTAFNLERGNFDTGAILTLTAQAAGTVTSADQTNVNGRGLACTFNQSAHTGTPSTTFSIQYKDTASASYVTLLTSAAIANDATPTALFLAAGANVANSSDVRPLPHIWRVSATVGGSTPVVTATVGCSVIR
jgi:hypothetical protein